jgi:hypothetical protein
VDRALPQAMPSTRRVAFAVSDPCEAYQNLRRCLRPVSVSMNSIQLIGALHTGTFQLLWTKVASSSQHCTIFPIWCVGTHTHRSDQSHGSAAICRSSRQWLSSHCYSHPHFWEQVEEKRAGALLLSGHPSDSTLQGRGELEKRSWPPLAQTVGTVAS